jgi:signal transduction histidine kinase
VLGRLYRLFGAEEDWVRPVHRRRALRADGLLAVLVAGGALVSVETAVSLGTLDTRAIGPPWTYLWVVAPVLSLAVRRVYPVTTLTIAIAHYLATAAFLPTLSPVFVLQIYYFFTLFNAVAWSPQRRAAVLMTLAMASAAALWVVGEVLFRNTLDQLEALPPLGRFPPAVAALVQVTISTLTFFLASSMGGVATWWSARREAQARERGVTIAQQAEQLRERSVTDERLRIARELHDVVGHHVALIGIQTSAARTVLEDAPDKAAGAMRQAEETSRAATRDLRLLLGALRVGPDDGESVVAQGSLRSVPDLVGSYEALGLCVAYRIDGPADAVPEAVALAAYRVVQESLTNVCRHSAATSARVELQVQVQEGDAATGGRLHLRVSDPGPARGDTSGSRVGIPGMQERAALHGGALTAGPTHEGGFVVEAELAWVATVTA